MKSQFRTHRALVLGAGVLLAACKPGEEPAEARNEAADSEAATAADAFLVLPGDYAQGTTVADLEARFGKSNVRRETAPEPRVVLFPDDPSRRAYVTFHETEEFKELARISVTDPGSRWRGKHGAHVGMTFAKLNELNGKPFFYFGFDERKRGVIRDGWSPALDDDDGALGAFDASEDERLYFEIDLGVGDPAGLKAASDLPDGEYLLSNDPRFPRLGELIVVTGIGASSSLDDEWE